MSLWGLIMSEVTPQVPAHLAPLARFIETLDIHGKNAHEIIEALLSEWTDPDKRSEIIASSHTYIELNEQTFQCKFLVNLKLLTASHQGHMIDVLLVDLKDALKLTKHAAIYYWIGPFLKLDYLPE